MTPEELEAQRVNPYVIPEEAGLGSIIHDTLFDTTQTSNLDNMTATDVEGNVTAVQPLPAKTEEVPHEILPQDVAKARVLNEGAATPETVDKKVGQESKTTTQTIESQDTKNAVAEIDKAQGLSQEASRLQQEGKDLEIKANLEKDEATSKVIFTAEQAKADVINNNQVKFQQAMADIDNRVTELSNYKPETFWGSKSQADKITAALSVGLGSFAQALLGSKENVGEMLLHRQMDEFSTNQENIYKNKLNAIQNMRISLDEKRKLADDLEKGRDAQKLAALAQVTGANAKAQAMAKTPQTQAAIMQQRSKLDMESAKLKEEIAAKHEQKIATNTEHDINVQVAKMAGTTDEGKALNAEQGNSLLAYSAAAPAAKNLQNVDWGTLSKDKDWQNFLMDQRRYRELQATGGVGGMGAFVSTLMPGKGASMGSPYEILAKQRPDLAQIFSNMSRYNDAVLRKKTGAAIGATEDINELANFFPIANETPEIQKEKNEARESQLDALAQTTGQYMQLRRKAGK